MNIQKYLHLWLYSLALVTERKRDLLGTLEHCMRVRSDVIHMSRARYKERNPSPRQEANLGSSHHFTEHKISHLA